MSAYPVNPAIQRLDFDILWHIFDVNANIFEDNAALRTTLATSRVCRDWRTILLSSTTIWAHVIDLDHSLWNSVEGSREILRRSGTALMWIQSVHYLRWKQSLNIIETNWERTQKLKLAIHNNGVDQETIFCRPAPHLELFSMDFIDTFGDFSTLFSSLFRGGAPMMHDFRLRGFRCDFPTSSWMRHLRSMELTGIHTVSEILGVLASTTSLTNLHLACAVGEESSIFAPPVVSPLPVISLPKLAHLAVNLSREIAHGASLMEHMRIPPSCVVTFSARRIDPREVERNSDFEAILGVVSTFAQPCFAHHLPNRLHVVITPSSFTLKATDRYDEPSFIISMDLAATHTFLGHTLSTFLRQFSLPGLSKVTFFAFRITRILRQVPELTTFMASLPSVETISTEELSLRHLRTYASPKGGDTSPRIVFPALKTLRLVSFIPPPELRCKFDEVRDPVSKYVMARIARGQPISTVEYTSDAMDVLPYMAFLRKAEGVKVLWRQRGASALQVYTCGTSGLQKVV